MILLGRQEDLLGVLTMLYTKQPAIAMSLEQFWLVNQMGHEADDSMITAAHVMKMQRLFGT